MSEETANNPIQRGSGVLKDPEKRQKIFRQLNAAMDGMRHGLMKAEDRERQGDYEDGEDTNKPEPTFEGTNVPISVLFMYFAEGKNYKDLLALHPAVKEEDVLTVIEAARHTITSENFVAKEMLALRRDIERLNQNSATNFKRLADAIKGMLNLK